MTEESAKGKQWDMPPVFHRFYVLTGWLLDRVEKFPKSARFTFGQRLTDLALSTIEKIVRAAYGRRRAENLEASNTNLEVLRVFLRLSKDRHYLSERQYEFAMSELLEIGKMMGGWLKTTVEADTRRAYPRGPTRVLGAEEADA